MNHALRIAAAAALAVLSTAPAMAQETRIQRGMSVWMSSAPPMRVEWNTARTAGEYPNDLGRFETKDTGKLVVECSTGPDGRPRAWAQLVLPEHPEETRTYALLNPYSWWLAATASNGRSTPVVVMTTKGRSWGTKLQEAAVRDRNGEATPHVAVPAALALDLMTNGEENELHITGMRTDVTAAFGKPESAQQDAARQIQDTCGNTPRGSDTTAVEQDANEESDQ